MPSLVHRVFRSLSSKPELRRTLKVETHHDSRRQPVEDIDVVS